MKKGFYKYGRYLKFIPVSFLIKLTGQKCIFPFYHVISDEEVIHIKHLYKVRSTKDFIRDLDFLLKEYVPLDPGELIVNHDIGVLQKRPSFVLTFDDGLRQFYEVVAPILKYKGIPAICFLNSAFIDNKDLFFRFKASILFERLNTMRISESLKTDLRSVVTKMGIFFDENYKFLFTVNYINKHCLDKIASTIGVDFQDYLNQYRPFMDKEQIDYLIKQGFFFGSHSIDHPAFFEVDTKMQIFQTEQSTSEISSLFNLDYKIFSFPFTDLGVSKQFFNYIFSKENRIVDFSFGSSGLVDDDFQENIQRIPIEIDDYSAKEIISAEYCYYLIRRIANRNQVKRF
jgi:peptidoglycan/xylan/chitin deacetylase (PgdA/CDA1 family)